MKFAFSTLTCPGWDLATVAARARDYGYDGVEWAGGPGNGPDAGDPAAAREAFESAGVEIACLSGPVLHTGRARDDQRQFEEASLLIERAAGLGCPRVKIFNTLLPRGRSALAAGVALGKWLLPLADAALARDVTLLIENAPGLRSARDVWAMLDRARHPALACCWDPFNAALVGEGPSLSVPVLNSRIQFAHVRDGRWEGRAGAGALLPCKLGEGNVEVAKCVARLRGVGFGGYVSAAWEESAMAEVGPPEELLPDALAKLKGWAKGVATSPVSKGVNKPTPTPREVSANK